MQHEPLLFMPASDLPDAIEFAPNSLAQRWLQHLGESDAGASLPWLLLHMRRRRRSAAALLSTGRWSDCSSY
eukprot:COSAG05_NODE_1039_length_6069_cov_34.005999_5_plen_72_part_00